MSLLTLPAAAAEAGGGAPLDQMAIVGGATSVLGLALLVSLFNYRRGRAPLMRRIEAGFERALGLPGWSALPGLSTIAFAVITILGATWDIGLHIDVGRDEGPLGTAAHYPLLLGLFGMFLMGVLAIGLAPDDPRKSSSVALRIPGFGAVPAAGVLLLTGSAFGMAAFPLDDLWHRIFGQDVTLWGPTHTMIIGGTLTAGLAGVLLLVEGARAAGKEPFRAAGTVLRRPLPALLGAVCLYLWAAATHEFNWGVPQYRQVWQPMLLAFGAGQALVLARLLAGRGGALYALAFWLPVQAFMSLMIGGPLEVTMPAAPLFVVEALLIEAIAVRRDPRQPLAFGVVAGAAVGTIGFAAEYGWSHVVMPLPWESSLLPEAIPVALIAGVAGGTFGALMAQALTGTLARGPLPKVAVALATVAFLGLGYNAADTSAPEVRATMTITDVRQGTTPNHDMPQQVGDLTVRFSDPSVTDDPQWLYAMAWQGGGRYVDRLVRQPDGSWRTVEPVPLDGTWKSMVRVHHGRTMLSVPVRFPADPAIGFAGFPQRAEVTRTMVSDTKLMQLERKDDAPMWAWTPATLFVLGMNLAILAFLGVVCVRLGRMAGRPPTVDPPEGVLVARADRVLRTVTRPLARA